MSCALLAATVDEGRRGARHSAGAGRVDVIGHPVGPDTYAGLHSVLAEARERGIPGRIPRHEHRVSTASRRSSASTCGTSPTSPPPPESMRVGGNKNRWKQESVETRIGGNKKGVFTRPAAQGGRPRGEATVGEDV